MSSIRVCHTSWSCVCTFNVISRILFEVFFFSLISFNWLFCLFYSKLILKLHRRVWNQFWKLTNKQITKLIWLSNSREFLDPMKNYRIFRIERLVAMFTFKRRNCCFSRKFDTIFRVKIQKFKFNVRTLQLTHTHIHAGTRKTWCITFFSAETIMKFCFISIRYDSARSKKLDAALHRLFDIPTIIKITMQWHTKWAK